MEISEEESRAYKLAKRLEIPSHRSEAIILADALQRAVARAMELEFKIEHQLFVPTNGRTPYCPMCVRRVYDERHNNVESDWLRLADEKLRGGK